MSMIGEKLDYDRTDQEIASISNLKHYEEESEEVSKNATLVDGSFVHPDETTS